MNVNVGFIGCGTLGGSIATGLAKAPEFKGKIILSDPFNRANIDRLYSLYPEKVLPVDSHEELLKQAEIIFPAVLPTLLPDIMSGLTFTERHKVIHVAAGIDLAAVAEHDLLLELEERDITHLVVDIAVLARLVHELLDHATLE